MLVYVIILKITRPKEMFKRIYHNTFERRDIIIVTNTSDVQTLTIKFELNTSVLDLCSVQHHNYQYQFNSLQPYLFVHIFAHIIYSYNYENYIFQRQVTKKM